jgi:DNA-binding HxlR family transcriptional regulator
MDKVGEAQCPQVEAAFALLAKKWAGLILLSLSRGELHFCELKLAIPDLSARVLSLRMRGLEEAGLVKRSVSEGSPVRVSYKLTEKGAALSEIMGKVAEWAQK